MQKEKFEKTIKEKLPDYLFGCVESEENDPLYIVVRRTSNTILATFNFAETLIYGLKADGSLMELSHIINTITKILEEE